eukprot:TRINITY_DN34832_c0_g2_i3.p6 TRINITY_DN34832_c0_g2~~TRINITY_DN34832_c0_g2_i3.p6  ORF type:complete len:155 (+),score=13.42 TRINITY_DN34832_c0_g2_i3:423-887(+)
MLQSPFISKDRKQTISWQRICYAINIISEGLQRNKIAASYWLRDQYYFRSGAMRSLLFDQYYLHAWKHKVHYGWGCGKARKNFFCCQNPWVATPPMYLHPPEEGNRGFKIKTTPTEQFNLKYYPPLGDKPLRGEQKLFSFWFDQQKIIISPFRG